MTFGIGIVLDIIFLVVLICTIRASARRGFVRTVVEMVGWLVLVYAAFNFSKPLAGFLYENFIRESMADSIGGWVMQSMSSTPAQTAANLWENLPGVVRVGFDMSQSGLQSLIESTVGAGEVEAQIANTLMQTVVDPMYILILRWIIIALIFGVGMLVVRALAASLNRLFSLPIIGSLNRTLGGVVGAVKGLIIILVLCILLALIFTFLPEGVGPINIEMLETSYTYQFIDGFDIFTVQKTF